MKKDTAKALGYKVIDEFGSDISSIVRLEFEEGEIVKVIDEFDCNIITRVFVYEIRYLWEILGWESKKEAKQWWQLHTRNT